MGLQTCEIISVGTELLLGSTVDTNAAELGQELARLGISCRHRQTVGDHLGRLTEAIRLALSRADAVILIGGLGPTQDDLTRDGIAEATGLPLTPNPALEAGLRELFARRGLRWVDSNLRQTFLPLGGEALPNPHGTAPGLWCTVGEQVVAALPGPPREFRPMMRGPLAERLQRASGLDPIHTRVLKVVGVGESRAEEVLRDLMASAHPTLAPYAKTGEVHLRLAAQAPLADVEAIFAPVEATIRERLGWHVYGSDEDTLESRILALLRERGHTLAVAESLTGGLVQQRLTAVPGSSDVFLGGVVSYSNAAKQSLLGVSGESLARETAVSDLVANEMAQGARKSLSASWGLATTGVAGPGPDGDGHAEGLTFVAWASAEGGGAEKHTFGMGREINRARAAQAALILLYRQLVGAPSPD